MNANSDGAMARSMDSGVGGTVLRDHQGAFCAGVCHFFPSAFDLEMAELLACRRAIQLAGEANVQRLVLETGSQAVVSKLQNHGTNFSVFGHFINEIKALLLSFQDGKVS